MVRLAPAMPPGAERADRFYAVVRMVARFWIWFLFRDVAVRDVGRVPSEGPVLLCVNHPNNLIDSLLVGGGAAAEGPLPGHRVAVPEPGARRLPRPRRGDPRLPTRRRPGPRRPQRRRPSPRAARPSTRGKVLAIYPEGTTHAEARVQRIKTGAARIALDYEAARATGAGARPAAARASSRSASRSRPGSPSGGRVLVAFGDPVPLGAYAGRGPDESRWQRSRR